MRPKNAVHRLRGQLPVRRLYQRGDARAAQFSMVEGKLNDLPGKLDRGLQWSRLGARERSSRPRSPSEL